MIPTLLTRPATRTPPFAVVSCTLLAMWVLAWLAEPAWLSMTGLVLNPHGHAALHAHGHPFVDARRWWGVPNSLDVVSDLPLMLAGTVGFWFLRGQRLGWPTVNALRVFFTGLILSGLGSAVYHWAPDAGALMIDRLGMAVAFAGVLALSVAERGGQREARDFLPVVFVLAVVSALLPRVQGNVRPWAVVQFGGVGLIAWSATRPPSPGSVGVHLAGVIARYAATKLLELGVEAVFRATGEWVSGHSLKHVAAACAALPILVGLRRIGLGDNAPVRPAAMG